MSEKTLALSQSVPCSLTWSRMPKNQRRFPKEFPPESFHNFIGTGHQRIRQQFKKLTNLGFDKRIITFPSKEKGEFDQPNSLDLSLPVTCNRYFTKLSVVKSIHFPFCRLLFPG